MRHHLALLIAPLLFVITVASSFAAPLPDDWPQILGPGRDGRYLGPPLANSWPASGPPVLWTKEVGAGFSGPIVIGKRVIFFHRTGDRDLVEALDATNGHEIWQFDYPAGYRDRFGFNDGPRASPTAAEDRVFTYSADGLLHALDLNSGKLLWSVDTHRQFDAGEGFFGAGASPLCHQRPYRRSSLRLPRPNRGSPRLALRASRRRQGRVE